MTCADTDRHFDEWLAGTLSESDARALEAHAAGCDACGPRLDQASLPGTLPTEIAPPATLRHEVLAAIAQRRRPHRRTRWLISASGIAAVLAFALLQQPRQKHASDRDNGAAILYAMDRARAEFEKLDAAEAEVAVALRATPEDRSLLRSLEDLRRQRAQLQKLVREAAS
ncbi:MAG: zf-HC2 domain-containing protein [Gemmatimonadales bacterium]